MVREPMVDLSVLTCPTKTLKVYLLHRTLKEMREKRRPLLKTMIRNKREINQREETPTTTDLRITSNLAHPKNLKRDLTQDEECKANTNDSTYNIKISKFQNQYFPFSILNLLLIFSYPTLD
jgi:hypothetical protein